MVQSVELVLDEDLDRLVRAEWEVLRAAGLPSQARHTGASNAPHVTLGVASAFGPAAEDALAAVPDPTGMPVRLGGWLVFGGRTSTLVRTVVPSVELLRLHTEVAAAMEGLDGQPVTTAVGRWTPHVTLARRLDATDLSAALAVLAEEPRELEGSIAGMRRWDADERRTWLVR